MAKATNTKKTSEEYVATIHAALALNVSVNTVYRWTNFKGFPDSAVKRVKGGNVYCVEEIRTWLASRKKSYAIAHEAA
jgi:predicted DNA-binding transcriptional regulator AlpA